MQDDQHHNINMCQITVNVILNSVSAEKKSSKPECKRRRDLRYDDVRWLTEDTNRRQEETNRAIAERNKRLAERDAEYARLFPHLVNHQTVTSGFLGNTFSDTFKRFY